MNSLYLDDRSVFGKTCVWIKKKQSDCSLNKKTLILRNEGSFIL